MKPKLVVISGTKLHSTTVPKLAGMELTRPRETDDLDEAEQLSPRVVHNHYTNSKNGNGSSLNKVIWAVAGVLAITILGIQSFVAAKVWDISERLARVEARQEIQQTRTLP